MAFHLRRGFETASGLRSHRQTAPRRAKLNAASLRVRLNICMKKLISLCHTHPIPPPPRESCARTRLDGDHGPHVSPGQRLRLVAAHVAQQFARRPLHLERTFVLKTDTDQVRRGVMKSRMLATHTHRTVHVDVSAAVVRAASCSEMHHQTGNALPHRWSAHSPDRTLYHC